MSGQKSRKLLFFGFQRLSDMLEKGNEWYVRNYEVYFDEIHCVYLLGEEPKLIEKGKTKLVSLGSKYRFVDLLLSPIRLWKYAAKTKPDVLLTADMVFGWWAGLLARWLGRFNLALMPVCIPEQIYSSTLKSLSGMPIFIERLFVRLSFALSTHVVTAKSFGWFVQWLQSDPYASGKLVVLPTVVDALPTREFFEAAQLPGRVSSHGTFRLVYVGRLHREKLVAELIQMAVCLRDRGYTEQHVILRLIGDGPEKESLQQQAKNAGIEAMVEFLGSIENAKLPKYLFESDVFVSPLTGSSLREAALCGVPIVAYDRDWIHGLLRHEHDALLVQSRDYAQLAESVIRLLEDEALRKQLSDNIHKLAQELWSRDRLHESLEMLHRAVSKPKALQS